MKKGFTLVELLGVIVILGIIATLTVPLIQRTIIEKNEEAYNLQIKSFEDAAKNWANDHIYELTCENTCVNPPLKTLTIEELQKEGLVREMRRLSEAIEKQNELKEIELGLKPNNKTCK